LFLLSIICVEMWFYLRTRGFIGRSSENASHFLRDNVDVSGSIADCFVQRVSVSDKKAPF
jgi:hypothetical protein